MFKKATLAALALCFSLSVPVFAEVESQQAQVGNLEMTWPVVHTKNKKADTMINKDIKTFMDDFRAGFVDRKFTSGRTWYETKYEDNQLVSLVLSDLRTQGGDNKVRTSAVVYELASGQRLPLSAFVRVTVADPGAGRFLPEPGREHFHPVPDGRTGNSLGWSGVHPSEPAGPPGPEHPESPGLRWS